jgi:ABC-type oligopeptide transport system ATPase subunit
MSELGFTPEWIPRRQLIREALAYAVRLRQVMRRLDEELSGGDNLNAVIDRAAIPLDSAEAAFLLSDEVIDALIDSIR